MELAQVPPIFRVVRVHIVIGGFLAFLLGALLAFVNGGAFNPWQIILFYAIVLFGDLSTHYSNDYFDVNVDKNITKRKFFSGSRILVNHPALLPLARQISITFFALSNVLALLAVIFWAAPIELLVVALGANFLGWAYSAPPLRLISRGLGELAIAVATGFAIPAVGYLSVKGQFDPAFLFLALPFILYGYILSLSLETPDVEVDRKGGKNNIAVRRGGYAVLVVMLVAVVTAMLMFVFYAWQTVISIIDLRWVVAFSAVPLATGVWGIINMVFKKKIEPACTANIFALFIFNLLMVSYLIIVAFGLI